MSASLPKQSACNSSAVCVYFHPMQFATVLSSLLPDFFPIKKKKKSVLNSPEGVAGVLARFVVLCYSKQGS